MVHDADLMSEGSDDIKVRLGRLPSADEIWICYQHEEIGRTWWLRWINGFTGAPRMSWECKDLTAVMSGIYIILDKVGLSL